jgi:glutathione synthase/RimK-type ligase-like ATP-grasp enzyme
MGMTKKILILTSGNVSKLEGFLDVDKASFSDIWFDSKTKDLKIKTKDLKTYKAIYFRMVGKSLEVATLVADYARKNNIKIVDKVYADSKLLPVSLGKSLELRRLIKACIPIPKTVFGRLDVLPFPFVVKSTTSSRAREVWKVENLDDLNKLRQEKFKIAKFYLAQELVPNSRRIRVLVIGDRAVGAIVRQTKWNRDETKQTLKPIPEDVANLAIKSAKAVDLDICGVDILVNSKTDEMFVIEANAAPSWKLINRYCGISVENEIIKYIQKQI